MLELRHLKTLVALAETGNLSKAGKRLNLSQPAGVPPNTSDRGTLRN
jgi:Transcriptional regulator